MRPLPARTATDGEAFEQNRKSRLQYFGIGKPAVGHVGLDRAGAVEVRPGPSAAGDRFVILVALVAEGEIVHRPLARRQRAAGGDERVGDDLADLSLTRPARRGIMRVEPRAFRPL